ncbi:Putative Pyruvate decarboxylase [[Torrubiella] hemipterigena]|uniref:Pyruvate decarboxylase n=1 Tax=[Torrubiella] hemipterigena TaxID=1531966 RepID=A0A0A1T779_9HYPO|nr:Putative Pyruvate decarboxylase [[Torrubiella] hemipterigena]
MPGTVKLATYLYQRLRQLGVDSLHGVPGDFNLTLLDYVEPAGLRWVGSANELNAAYAADGYSRVKGVGALVTTFGVGELSAINAIAGAFSERAAVVHIVGIPARPLQDGQVLVHHTLKDGNFTRFSQAHALFTVAQARLWDPRTSAEQIDECLRQCLHHSRPVYIEVPVDLVSAPLDASRLEQPLQRIPSEPVGNCDRVVASVLEKIHSAKQPLILFDGESRGMGIVEEVQALTKTTGWPTWATCFSKGLLDETASNFHGIYKGKWDEESIKTFFSEADLILCFGPHFSTTNSYGGTAIPNASTTISLSYTEANVCGELFRDVPGKFLATKLVQGIDASKIKKYEPYPELPRDYLIPYADVVSDEPLTHDRLWQTVGNFLRPGDILMGETGTCANGVRVTPLPLHTRLFTAVTWLSIGYMLPAAQGAALAQQELMDSNKYHGIKDARTVLFIGDGSFQMTAQELATIIRHNVNVVVVLVNNDGYTIERCIHGRSQRYNDVTPWRYLKAPEFFGAPEDHYTATIRTWRDLEKVFTDEKLVNGTGLRMVELFLDRDDAPQGPIQDYMTWQKAGNGIMEEKE